MAGRNRSQPLKQVTIHTEAGDMRIEFFPNKAPQHVENFIDLAEKGFYDNKTFHRIVDGFMIQGGCPRGDGTGDGPRRLKAEFNDTPHVRGVVSMARAADPNSASCQFFICLDDARFLDRQYTAFGRLADEESVRTLLVIGKTPTKDNGYGEKSKPKQPVKITKMSVQEVEE
jgi:peptidyl-prolyl cis-trans isomerase B (cyclophilin B)